LFSFLGESLSQTFLFFELVSNNLRVTTNVRNDQRVGLRVEYMRDNLSLCAAVHGYTRIPNLFQRDMYTLDCIWLGTAHHLFIDVKTGYDSVRREVLCRKLIRFV
jgi:hypothetical protein